MNNTAKPLKNIGATKCLSNNVSTRNSNRIELEKTELENISVENRRDCSEYLK